MEKEMKNKFVFKIDDIIHTSILVPPSMSNVASIAIKQLFD